MIVETKELPSNNLESLDEPPAYDELTSRSPPGFRQDQKTARDPASQSDTPVAGPSSPRAPATPNAAGCPNKTWFGLGSWFSDKDSRNQVKQTIQSLIRDVVREPASPASVSVVQSCLEACQARGLSFAAIVSERFIEGHSPLYWAIIKLPPDSAQDSEVHLLDMLLSFPLTPQTRADAYLACLLSSDQALFQRLRRAPGCQLPSVSATAELLLGDEPLEELSVENQDGDHGEFRVHWRIAHFQKRMRVVGGVGTEVVARGRIWCLAFVVLARDVVLDKTRTKAGSWVASVSLLSPSPPTHLVAQLSIEKPPPAKASLTARSPSPQLTTPPSYPPAAVPHTLPLPTVQTRKDSPRRGWQGISKYSQKPAVTLTLKTSETALEALPLGTTAPDLHDHVLTQPGLKTLVVPLNNHPNGDSLQFDGCAYLDADGSLSVTFDARLANSYGSSCTIC